VFVTPITSMSRGTMVRRRLQAGFVDIIHSRYAGDQILTGQPVDGGGKYADSNGGSPNGTGPMRFGISTQPGIQQNLGITYEQNVENAFNTVALQNTVQGKSQVNGMLVTGLSTIVPDTALTPATM
jgi:hypothetical protein